MDWSNPGDHPIPPLWFNNQREVWNVYPLDRKEITHRTEEGEILPDDSQFGRENCKRSGTFLSIDEKFIFVANRSGINIFYLYFLGGYDLCQLGSFPVCGAGGS